tara:strand:+ start:351 stop:1973 length:1623 start_codon:yes stop_codon:yes gene_type:complete
MKTRPTYAFIINANFLKRLNESFSDNFRPNKTVCEALGVDFNNLPERSTLLNGKTFEINDLTRPGMVLVVTSNHNRRTWEMTFKYEGYVGKTKKGRRRRRTFATYPLDSFPVVEQLYEEVRGSMRRGVDWFEDIVEKASKDISIRTLYPKFLAYREDLTKRDELAIETVEADKARYLNHIAKVQLNNMAFIDWSIGSIKRAHIIQLKETLIKSKVRNTKTKKWYVRGASVVNGIVANLKSFYDWAEDHNHIAEHRNPVYRISKIEAEEDAGTSIEYTQMAEFMNYLLTEYKRSSNRVRIAIYLCFKTGQRVSEICKIKWEDIVINTTNNQRVLFIRNKKSRRKNRRKNQNVWPVYLDDEMLTLLNSIPRLKDNPYVFWTDRYRKGGTQHLSSPLLNSTMHNAQNELGMQKFTPHDIKRSIVTHDDSKYGREHVKITTGNKSDRVLDQHYVRNVKGDYVNPSLYDKVKDNMERRSKEIGEVMNLPTPENNVVNFVPPKEVVRDLDPKTLNPRQEKMKKKIKKKYGISPSTYYRKKKEGYYE